MVDGTEDSASRSRGRSRGARAAGGGLPKQRAPSSARHPQAAQAQAALATAMLDRDAPAPRTLGDPAKRGGAISK